MLRKIIVYSWNKQHFTANVAVGVKASDENKKTLISSCQKNK